MKAQVNVKDKQIYMMNGSPRELLAGLEREDIGRIFVNPPATVAAHEYDIQGLVTDSLKHFYSVHQNSGFKACTCNPC